MFWSREPQGRPRAESQVAATIGGRIRTVIKIRRSGKFGRQMIRAGQRRSWRSRLGVLAAIVSISAPVVLAGGSATASAFARVVNDAAQVVPGTSDLDGIACWDHDNCVAVGTAGPNPDEGVVVPITDGIPGTPELVPGTSHLFAVTCPTTLCFAVGNGPYTNPPEPTTVAGVVVPITDGTPGGVQTVIGPGQPGAPDQVTLWGVGCSSADSCLAGGSDVYMGAVIVPIEDGASGNEESVFGVSGSSEYGVACRKISFCMAVGLGNGTSTVLRISTNGKVRNEGGPAGAGRLTAVSCRNTAWCLVAGTNRHEKKGVVALVTNGAPGSAVAVSGSSLLQGVACRPATTECLVVGYNSSNEGVVAGINDGTPGTAQVVAGTEGLLGVACPTNTSCLVVGTTVGKHSLKGVLAMIHLPPL
jgi:hypothetical protein